MALTNVTSTDVTDHTATVSCTTDIILGTVYGIVTTVAGLPTAEQVSTGMNSLGLSADYDFTSDPDVDPVAVESLSDLSASTVYYQYWVQDEDGLGTFGTVVGGSFETIPDQISNFYQTPGNMCFPGIEILRQV